MFAWLTASAICLGLAGTDARAAESLYVFFPTTVRPHVLQKGLSGSGLDVTAFGRFADFEDKVKSEPPAAILTLPEVIGTLDGYTVAIAGKHDGEARNPYFLLSVDKPVDISRIGDGSLGMVDFLGRKGMRQFVAGLFPSPPDLKTVAKIEDLLPLLTFRMVEEILVTRAQADYFRSISRLNFVITPVPQAGAGTICLAVRKGAEAPKAIRAVKTMDAELRKLLGNVQWD